MRQVLVSNTLKGVRVPRSSLTKLGQMILKSESSQKDVSLVFISDQKMLRLNKQYRGKNTSTDVLSFSLDDDIDSHLGEIYISHPHARRNASEYGIPVREEILKLFAHGVLHLLGIHHPTAAARQAMANKEDFYLTKLRRLEAR